MWQGEYHMVVGDRYTLVNSCLHPFCSSITLALGAMPVATGVVANPHRATTGAHLNVAS